MSLTINLHYVNNLWLTMKRPAFLGIWNNLPNSLFALFQVFNYRGRILRYMMCHEIWQVTPDKPKPCEFWNHTFAFEKTALRIIVGAVFSKPLMMCIPTEQELLLSFPQSTALKLQNSSSGTWGCTDVYSDIPAP